MSSVRDKVGKAGLFIAGSVFHIALFVLSAVLLIWLGQTAYGFGYQIFNEHAMNPGEGRGVTVVIEEGSSVYEVGKTLESKGLIENAYVFVVQEFISAYHDKIRPGTYELSTALTPTRILEKLAEDTEEQGADAA